MKTIALHEKTFELLSDMKEKRKASSFDEVVRNIVLESGNIQDSLFGKMKGKIEPFTRKEREEFWDDGRRR